MDKIYIDENQIEIKYLRGQLSDKELEMFEVYLMEDPSVLERLELEQVFTQTLKDKEEFESAAEMSAVETIDAAILEQSKVSLLQRFIAWICVPIPAYASLMLAVGAASIVAIRPNSEPIELVGFSTLATRGAQLQSDIDLSQVNGRAAVMIKLKEVQYQFYVLIVSSLDGQHIWQSDNFQVSALKDKLILLPNTLDESAIKIQVSGLEKDSSKTAVKFCHYSEVCR